MCIYISVGANGSDVNMYDIVALFHNICTWHNNN